METDPDYFAASALSSSARHGIATIYVLLAIPGCLLNTIVLLTFFADRSLLAPGNLFIVSIAVADWLMAGVANPIGAYVSQGPSKIGCKVYAWICTLLGLGTMLHHSAIAIDKCRTLWHPMNPVSCRTRVVAVIVLLWCFALMWSFFPLLGWNAYVREGANTVCSIRWYSPYSATNTSYVVCIFVFFFFIPLLIIIISYTMAYWNVRRMVKQAEITWGANAEATLAAITESLSLAKISVMVVTGFLVAWTPHAVVSFYSAVAGPDHIPAVATIVPAMFAKSSCLYNPLICFFVYKKFRVSLWMRWQKVRGRNVQLSRPAWNDV